jgi:signal recognition particle GTPase
MDGFTLDDFIALMRQVETLPAATINVPGAGDIDVRRQMCRVIAVYDSMNPSERTNPDLLDARRRRRIAAGAGVAVTDVSRIIKQFQMSRDMMRAVRSGGGTDRPRAVLGLVTDDPTRRDPSWVHRFAPRFPDAGMLVGWAIVAALVALGVVVFLYQLTR